MSSAKVLIVDDATTFRKLLSIALEGIGITSIIECDSAESARNELQPGTEIQLIICDWHMPGETGMDLLRWIRSQAHLVHIPFIMLTTEQERGHILEAARVGIQGYIFKPIQKITLVKKLHELGLLNAS